MCNWPTLPATPERRRQRGVSLVEFMVAAAIGMFTILAVVQTMTFFEGQRRGTGTGADTQSSSAFAAYMLERDLRMAGYGVFADENNMIEACAMNTVVAYNAGRVPPDISFDAGTVPFVPVIINPPGIPGGDPDTDVIGIAYSDSAMGITGKGTLIGLDSPAQGFVVNNTAGFMTGDLVLAVPNPGGIATGCRIQEITDGPGAVNCTGATAATGIEYTEADYPSHYFNCAPVPPQRNKPGGFGLPSGNFTQGRLFNLGRRDGLVNYYYAVRNGRLTRCDHFAADCSNPGGTTDARIWVPLVDDIAALRAEFGVASGGVSAAVDTWRPGVCPSLPCTPNLLEWQNLRVIRFVVVARSQQPTPEGFASQAPVWNGQTPILLGSGWERFRYTTIETVVPLRNIVWGSTS